MKQRRRRGASEINLTPLLDVLFSILFIIMMTGMQNEKSMKENYQQQANQMEVEISNLREQVNSYENQISSYDEYQTDAIIVTVNNIVKTEKHYLVVKKGIDNNEIENIQLGVNKNENTKVRINKVISELVELSDNQPVYIIFYCDKKRIYTTEYTAIVDAFNGLQEANKEVFFKVMEDNK